MQQLHQPGIDLQHRLDLVKGELRGFSKPKLRDQNLGEIELLLHVTK